MNNISILILTLKLSMNMKIMRREESLKFLTSFYDGQVLITYIVTCVSSNYTDDVKKNRIVIISTIGAGLICLGIFVWLVWRFKGKLKGEISISLDPKFLLSQILCQ